MKIAGRILALLFAVVLFGLAIANLPLTLKALDEGMTAGQGLEGVRNTVQSAYLTDEFWQKNEFVNINGLHARLSGRRELNDVVLMRNGMLGYSGNASRSMNLQAAGISQFSEWLQAVGSDFLFVQMPYKLDMKGEMLPLGHEDYLHENATDLLDMLAERGVATLDLRDEICATVAQVNQYFYPTDHHWSAKGAMKGFEMVLEQLQEMFPDKSILSTDAADPYSWQEHTLKNYFLGSQGKRVGQLYAGVDDLVWYTPLFDTSMSMYIQKYRKFTAGTFEDAVMQKQYVEEAPDYFNLSPYNVYVGGDYPLVVHRNGQAAADLKLLIIKDSFTLPLQSFLSTVFTSVEVIDPRHFTEKTIAEHIRQTSPDVVMLAVNPAGLSLPEYYSFDTPDAHEYYELTEVFSEPVRVAAKDGNYNYTSVPAVLEANTLYRADLKGLTVTDGQTDGVTLVLFNRSESKFLDSWVIDLDYFARTGDGTWYFRTPDVAGCELLVYAGIQGSTDGVGVACSSVTVSKATAAYPEGYTPRFKTLVNATDVTLTPGDDAYRYQALSAALESDAEYTLTLNGVTLDAGETESVLLALFDNGSRKRVETRTVAVESAGGSSVTWTFRTPAEPEGKLSLLLYAGMPGKTNFVGVTFRGLTLVKNLIPAAEGETAAVPADSQPVASPADVPAKTTAPAATPQPAPEAAAPELPENHSFTLAATDSDYQYNRIPLTLEPGAAYTLTIGSLAVTEGKAEVIDVTLYAPEQKAHLASTQLTPGQKELRWTFRAPQDEQPCQLLVYAGKRGATAGVSLAVDALTVTRTADAPSGNVVFLQDVTIKTTELDYNYEALEIALEPGKSYRLTVDEVTFLSGASEVLSFSLYDQATKTHLLRHEAALTTDGSSPACTWDLETPEGDASSWRILVYAGNRSTTAGVGVTCSGLMVVQGE